MGRRTVRMVARINRQRSRQGTITIGIDNVRTIHVGGKDGHGRPKHLLTEYAACEVDVIRTHETGRDGQPRSAEAGYVVICNGYCRRQSHGSGKKESKEWDLRGRRWLSVEQCATTS